ncbi:hypothetical protein BDZ45DRAFT_745822 [Acephala macrosclerotiorum]|nr:hypothetical protein BDZ45DRAFT_745822 [Acephala macrosclerotiorum]
MKIRILEGIRYSSMQDRFGRIPAAYRKTFDWIFSKDDTGVDVPKSTINEEELENVSDGEHDPRWDNFVRWLRSDDDLYWITGKPGSGKSTLVKYLHADPRTCEHLQSWRGASELIIAGFFFWNSGAAMQMSERGLIQTLLYQAINDRPELIPTLLPDRWRYSQLFGNDLRPWLVFEDAFKHRPSLRLEDLTAPDIKVFVLDNLSKSDNFAHLQRLKQKEANHLVLEITEKAQGVFFWVHLVVQSLLEGMRNGDSLADLQDRLLSLPSDLEELFKKILSCIDQRYLKHASRFFQLVRTASEPLSLLTFSYAEEGIDVAMCTEIKILHLEERPEEKLSERLAERMFRAELMRRRVNSRSKGLLEAPDFKNQGYKATVQYFHRTVKDFLTQNRTGDLLQSWLSDPFDADLQICAGYMVDVKSIDITHWIDQNFAFFTETRSQGDWRAPKSGSSSRRTGILLPPTFGNSPVGKISVDDFWVPFKHCINYALRVEGRQRDLHIAILNEMERIG